MLKVEYKAVEKLIPYARNARTHTDAQVAQIAASIKEFGWTNPILIDEQDGIIAGHGRVLAARKLGKEEVPCIRLSGLSESQKRAYIIADNKLPLNAGWDEELLKVELSDLQAVAFDFSLLGFEKAELTDLLRETAEDTAPAPEAQEDKADELHKKWQVQRGQLWQMGEHRLLCGDSTNPDDVAKLMQGQKAILFATDPP